MSTSALTVSVLSIGRRAAPTGRQIVSHLSLEVQRGECLGLVGESGSGKSLTLRAIMGLLPESLDVTAGTVSVDGMVLPSSGATARRARRGRLAMVFQDPAAALNPLMRIGTQIAAVRRHVRGRSRQEARRDALALLEQVRIADPAAFFRRYPHELSGGQRQRVMIAIALASEPEFLLCDEPTTALDVTVQDEILTLLEQIRTATSVGVLFVSHDLPVVARASDRLVVMRHGALVEAGDTHEVLVAPREDYTRVLVQAAKALAGRGRP